MYGCRAIFDSIVTMFAGGVLLGVSVAHAQPSALANPRLYGLLIGASDYQNPAIPDLASTADDVALMAEVMRERGAKPADLVVLADATPNPTPSQRRMIVKGAATRALIVAELGALIGRVKSGDHVVLYFSGHGEQQPNPDRIEEPDGMDEVFLPIDASVGGGGAITNGLRDNDIGAAVRALREAGANVYLIADFCHSDGASRSATSTPSSGARGTDMRMSARELDPGAGSSTNPHGTLGGFAGFYAAPSLTQAWGREVPYWMPENRPVYGVLTYYFATALRDPNVSNIGELSARLDRDVLNQSWLLDGGATPSPQFEGDTTLPLPGGTAANGAVQEALWTVIKPATGEDANGRTGIDALNLPAGSLHGVQEGAIFSLSVPLRGGVVGARDRVTLYGRAIDVTPISARLIPYTMGNIKEDAWRNLVFEGAPWTMEARFTAREVLPGRQESVGVALPEANSGGTSGTNATDTRLQRQLARALDMMGRGNSDVRFVPASDKSTAYALRWDHGALVLDDRSGSAETMPVRREVARFVPFDAPPVRGASPDAPPPEMRAALRDGLGAATRFHRLRAAALRVADVRPAAAGWQGSNGVMEGLSVRAWRLRLPNPPHSGQNCPAVTPDVWAPGQRVPARAVEITTAIAPGGAAPDTFVRCDMVLISVTSAFSDSVAASLQAQGALPDSGIVTQMDDWRQRCTRVRGATASDFEDLLCQQYADVGLVLFGSDTAIAPLPGSEQGGSSTRLAVNGTVTFGFQFERAAPAGQAVREDLLLLVARPDPRSPGVRASFAHLCQLGAGEYFAGSAGRRTCNGGVQGPRRESPAPNAPVFDPLADFIWSSAGTATRGATPSSRPANTTARRFTFEVGG